MDKKQDIHRIRKGDAFVQTNPRPLVFMEVNEVEESTKNMVFCTVTWYTLNEKGLNVQRRFPMAARDGKFCKFEQISCSLLKVLRQYDTELKKPTVKTEAKMLCNKYTNKLIKLLSDAEDRLAIALQDEKKIFTNKWFDCTEDNYWVEELELHDLYIALVCITTESYDDENDKTISDQFIYLHKNCLYSWNTLIKIGAKFMIIEKPKNS